MARLLRVAGVLQAAAALMVVAACGATGEPALTHMSADTPNDVSLEQPSQHSYKCGLDSLMYGVGAIVSGDFGIAGPEQARYDSYWDGELRFQPVQFTPRQVHANATGLPIDVGVQAEAIVLGSIVYGSSGTVDYELFEVSDMVGTQGAVAFIESFATEGGDTLRIRHMLREAAGGYEFIEGPCSTRLNDDLGLLTERTNTPAHEVLSQWVSAPVDTATGESVYVRELIAAQSDRREQALDLAWQNADPTVRSLRPADVPSSMQGSLDVRAVVLNLEGISGDDVVVLRTESGVSGYIHGDVLPTVQPVYMTADDEVIEVLIGAAPSGTDPRPLVSIETRRLDNASGVQIDGTADNAKVSLLSLDQLAERMQSTPEQLERLRVGLLNPVADQGELGE